MLRSALKAANDGLLADYERRLNEKEVRQANIYLREYSEARKANKDIFAAQGAASNALTRAALPRVDGQDVNSMSKRDREVFALEAQLKERIRSEMTAEELEQLDMLEGMERHVNRRFGEGFIAEDAVYRKAWFLPRFFVCKNPTFIKTPCPQQLLQLVCVLLLFLLFCPCVLLQTAIKPTQQHYASHRR